MLVLRARPVLDLLLDRPAEESLQDDQSVGGEDSKGMLWDDELEFGILGIFFVDLLGTVFFRFRTTLVVQLF